MKGKARSFLAFISWTVLAGPADAALPGAPTQVLAIPGKARATVHLTPPASDGGQAITSYVVTASPGGVSASGPAWPLVIEPLVNGVSYTFTARAVNAAGQGPASSPSNPVTPVANAIAPAVAAGQTFVAALDSSGQVYAWGADGNGQLGQGRQLVHSSPTKVDGIPAIKHFSLDAHVLAVDTTGQVWSWGDACGALGPRDTLVPSKPSRVIGANNVDKVAAGYCHSYALRNDGTVIHWGLETNGAVQALAFPAGIVEISAGVHHLLARRNDNTVWAFGSNQQGALGQGHQNDVSAPVQVPGITNAVAVAGGYNTSTVLLQGGERRGWGYGYSSMSPLSLPGLGGPLPGGAAIAIDASWAGSGAVRADGTVWISHFGPTAFQVSGLSGASRVAYGGNFAQATVSTGTGGVFINGSNNRLGLLAQGHTNDLGSTTVALPGFTSTTSLVKLATSSSIAMALKADGTLWFWGANQKGQRGDGIVIGSSVPLAVPIPATIEAIGVTNNSAHALDDQGRVWGWGSCAGTGCQQPPTTATDTSVAALIPGVTGVKAIAARDVLAYIRTDKTAWVSGNVAVASNSTQGPRQIPGLANMAGVAAGLGHVLFMGEDGKVYSAGVNNDGQLGDGTTTTRETAAQVPGITGSVVKVAANGTRSAALMSDGRIYQWGSEGFGGPDLSGGTRMPKVVAGITDAVDVDASLYGLLARRANGSVLALGTTFLDPDAGSNIATPFQIPFHEPVQGFSLGHGLGYIIGAGGVLWGWGNSSTSQVWGTVGDGVYVWRRSPVVIHAHAGSGSLDGNNWFLDLQPNVADTIPVGSIPRALAVSRRFGTDSSLTLDGTVKYKSADLGKRVSNYVLGLVPPSFLNQVHAAAFVSSPKRLEARAAKNGGFVLVQLTPGGWADVTGQLLPFSQGLASAAGTASNILNSINASTLAGARFCVGYGETADAMLSSSSLREVLVLEGASATSSGVPCVLSGVYVNGPLTSVQASPVTFTASVVGIGPEGSVQFRDGTSALGGPVTLAASNSAVSTAAITTASLSVGTHSIGAGYTGDAVNGPAMSETVRLHTVSGVSQTAIQGASGSELGGETTFVATVTGNNPGGYVQFKDGAADLGSAVAVAGGMATLRTSNLALGAHSITAAYLGDGTNAPSTSAGLPHTVVSVLPTRVEIATSANPINAGSPVTVTVSVTGIGATPNGTVSLRDWAELLDSKPLSAGSASFTLGALAGGLHAISAHYSGDNPATSSGTLFLEVSVPPGLVSVTAAKVGSGSGAVSSNPMGIDCGATCAGTFLQGSSVTLTAAAAAGSQFHGWTGAPGCGGNATCTVSPSQSTSVTATFQLFSPIPRLGNISTRALTQTGDNVIIGGFIIGGTSPKTVLVRARGPSMAQFGVPGLLANPQLQLYSGQTQIASNDDWQLATNAAAITASGFAPTDSRESAILTTLDPGGYTAIVTGVGGATGVAIVEVFEVSGFAVPLLNISTRGPVQTGDNVMIGGFIIEGSGPQTVVVRARGPSMAQFGVPNLLANPVLTLYSGSTAIATNDDWGQATNASAITASGFAPTDSRESAILTTLQPGAYTAIVTGAGGSTGIAIVEVFKN